MCKVCYDLNKANNFSDKLQYKSYTLSHMYSFLTTVPSLNSTIYLYQNQPLKHPSLQRKLEARKSRTAWSFFSPSYISYYLQNYQVTINIYIKTVQRLYLSYQLLAIIEIRDKSKWKILCRKQCVIYFSYLEIVQIPKEYLLISSIQYEFKDIKLTKDMKCRIEANTLRLYDFNIIKIHKTEIFNILIMANSFSSQNFTF